MQDVKKILIIVWHFIHIL